MMIARSTKHRRKFFSRFALAALVSVGIGVSNAVAAASGEVQVYASADDASPVIESVSDGRSLAPIAEMTGAGGVKWFMVKTKSGNVGWIKAGDNSAAKIDDHFHALPKDSNSIGPVSEAPTPAAITTPRGAITIPVRIERRKVLVPVTLSNGVSSTTGTLVVDTGASQTMISKRLARQLRLGAVDTQSGKGIGVAYVTDVGQVESVKVGVAEVRNMRVTINDGSNAFGAEGLLGYDFLGRFRMSVDADKKVMVLIPHNQ